MKITYTFNYLKIYILQGFSIVLNFLSMFIVIPMLTSDPSLYGIYALCIASSIFLAYADIGFVGAGMKYASESFAKQRLDEEIDIEGFVCFVLLLFVCLFASVTIFFSFHPGLLIKGLIDPAQIKTASRLLLILACFAPTTVLQRFLSIVYGVRLEDYYNQMFFISANFLKIFSVFYFFSGSRYDIVGYFLFVQLMNLTAVIASLVFIHKRYHIGFIRFLRSLRFSSPMYQRTKKLALSSFFISALFILYFELDPFAIAKLLGPEKTAFYAIGLSMLSFFRTIFGTIYSPFFARFNHFVGLGDTEGLKGFIYRIIFITMPLVIFPVISVFMLMKPLVIAWVGWNYEESVFLARFLVLGYIFAFIAYPAVAYLMAYEKIKEMNGIIILTVMVFWGGIFLTYQSLGLKAFAIFKLVTFVIMFFFYFHLIAVFLEKNVFSLAREIAVTTAAPVIFLIVSLYVVAPWLPLEKNKAYLLIVLVTALAAPLVSTGIYYLLCRHFRVYINDIRNRTIARFRKPKPGIA